MSLVAALAASLALLEGGAYADAIVATPGLVAYWRLEETTTSSGVAEARALYAGTFEGTGVTVGVTVGVTGPLVVEPSRAMRFQQGWVSVPHRAAFALTAYSVEAWVLYEAYGPSTESRPFLQKDTFQSAQRQIFVGLNQTVSDRIEMNHTTTTGAYVDAVASGALSLNVWHHVVATSGPSAQLNLYVDGVLVATRNTNANQGPYVSSAPFTFGAPGINSPAIRVDEVAFYGRSLTAQEVLAHYQLALSMPDAGPPDAGVPDSGFPDSGRPDGGLDAGAADAGTTDAGPTDAGTDDAGMSQVDAGGGAGGGTGGSGGGGGSSAIGGGDVEPLTLDVACGCSGAPGLALLALGLLIRRRRQP